LRQSHCHLSFMQPLCLFVPWRQRAVVLTEFIQTVPLAFFTVRACPRAVSSKSRHRLTPPFLLQAAWPHRHHGQPPELLRRRRTPPPAAICAASLSTHLSSALLPLLLAWRHPGVPLVVVGSTMLPASCHRATGEHAQRVCATLPAVGHFPR
jgi:hypothetical protein